MSFTHFFEQYLDNALAQTALPKTSKVLILDDCGHMGYIEKPKEVLEFIKYFAK